MTLYRWDSVERKFARTSVQNDLALAERVRTKHLSVSKGQRTRAEVATGDLLIRVLSGSWRMQIANSHLTVHHDEAVVIPSGFSHSAEAIEDSLAEQIADAPDHTGDESLWAV